MSVPPASFPRRRESSASSLQRRWIPGFAGTTIGPIFIALAVLLSIANVARAEDSKSISPYAATPDSVVEAMLTLAAVGPRDFVISR